MNYAYKNKNLIVPLINCVLDGRDFFSSVNSSNFERKAKRTDFWGDNIQIKEQARGKGRSGQCTLIEKHYEQLVHSQL